MIVNKNKFAKFIILLFAVLMLVQGALAAGEGSQVTFEHVDQATLSTKTQQEAQKGDIQVIGDGDNYQYTLVYAKEKLAISTSPAPTESNIPLTGDEGLGLFIFAGAMIVSIALLILLAAEKKKWSKGMLVLLLVLSLGSIMQQTAEAAGVLPADVAVEVAIGEKYTYSPPVVEGYIYFGYAIEKIAAKAPAPVEGKVLVYYVDEQGNELAEGDTLAGIVGEAYQSRGKAIYGWEVASTEGASVSGNFTLEEQTVKYVYQRKSSFITAIYTDRQGNELAAKSVFSENVGEAYETQAAEIENYRVEKIIGEAAGIVIEQDVTVEYVYKELPKGTVIVYYVDEESNNIIDPISLQGYVGKPYDVSLYEFDGYELICDSGDGLGVFEEETIEVFVYYERNLGEIIIYYIDDWLDPLRPRETIIDFIGTSYHVEPRVFPGYRLVDVKGELDGILGEELIEIRFYYDAIYGKLTVKHVDVNGTEISSPVIQSGGIGYNYKAYPLSLSSGWEVVRVEGDPAEGIYPEDPLMVTYVYKKSKSVVTANFLDLDGNEIASPIDYVGFVGDYFEVPITAIENYDIHKITGKRFGYYGIESAAVTFIYEERPKGTVIVNYVNELNEAIIEPMVLPGYAGKEYQTEEKYFANHVIKSVPNNKEGKFIEGTIEITYYYERVNGMVIVHYLDDEGKVLLVEKILKGFIGEGYQVVKADVDGYRLLGIEGDLAGEFRNEQQDVYIYII